MGSRRYWIVVVFTVAVAVGCGVDLGEIAPKATNRVYRDGRIYVINNMRPLGISWWKDNRTLLVKYEGQQFYVPHNMTFAGEPTLAGAVLITPEPLPGGTLLDFIYATEYGGSLTDKILSMALGGPLVIDGDLTVDFYNEDWNQYDYTGLISARVIPGKFSGTHEYAK